MLHTMPQSSDKRPVAGLAAPQPKQARIGVLVVAYNADTTLAKVLDRIPADFRKKIAKVYVATITVRIRRTGSASTID